jgi:PAS domain S-box-containing protein
MKDLIHSCAEDRLCEIGMRATRNGACRCTRTAQGRLPLALDEYAPETRGHQLPTRASISDWGRRVSVARARLTTEMRASDVLSPLGNETNAFLDELRVAFEELQVAEEELHVQTEELSTTRTLLESERLRYRTLFEHAPVPYVVTDAQGVISDANRATAKFLGVPQRYLRSKPFFVFVSPSARRGFFDQLATLGDGEREIEMRLRLRPRGRGLRSVSAFVSVTRGLDGAANELCWLLVDQTKRRRRERRVRTLNEELKARVAERTVELEHALETQQELAAAADAARLAAERASREKTELIAIVSHELRTPLAAIGGYAELLALDVRGPLTDPQRADIGRIQEAQSHILRLLEDLAGYSKLETGRLRFDISDVIVRDAIDALASFVRPQAAAKGITVTVLPRDGHPIVRADSERLRQIVLNLLSNAIKFTPRDGHVWISAEESDTDVRIAIRDDGIGIPPEKLETVFEPYVQLTTGTSREMGSGLGLAISRDLARAMDGDLLASSGQEGTVFTLKLPRSTRIAPRA